MRFFNSIQLVLLLTFAPMFINWVKSTQAAGWFVLTMIAYFVYFVFMCFITYEGLSHFKD